jgi:hypothetical protein
MVFILMTMVVSIKTCEAAPASQIDGKWEGMLTGCCYGVVYDFTFKGDSVKIIINSCDIGPYSCLNSKCIHYFINGLFKQTTDSILINGKYADTNFIVNTFNNGCVNGSNKIGTFIWDLNCRFASDTIFLINSGGDSGPDKLIRKTTGVIKNNGLVSIQNAFSSISVLICNSRILLNNSDKSNNLYVKIFDFRGKLVFSQKGSSIMLIPDKFQSGIYYLSVSDNKNILLKKQFVINR